MPHSQALDILQDTSQTFAQQLFAIFEQKLVPEAVLQEFVCDCTEYVLKWMIAQGREVEPYRWEMLKIKRQWLKGEIEENTYRQMEKDARLSAQRVSAQSGDVELANALADAASGAEYTARAMIWFGLAIEKVAQEDPGLSEEVSSWQREHFTALLG